MPLTLPWPELQARLDALIAGDAPLDALAVDSLIEAAYGDDGRLSGREQAALREIVRSHPERLAPSGQARFALLDRLDNATLRDAAHRLAADGVLSLADVAELARLAEADGRVSDRERVTAAALLDFHAARLAPDAKAALARLAGLAPHPAHAEPPAGAITLGGNGPHAVFRLSDGRLSTRSDRVPETFDETGDALYRAANLVDHLPTSAHLLTAATAAVDAGLRLQLEAALVAGREPPPGVTSEQALQMRASAHTCLVHLAECVPATAEHLAEKRAAEEAAMAFARAEDHPVLAEAFAAHLHRAVGLTAAGRQAADALFMQRVPVSPPYGGWFVTGEATTGEAAPTLVVHWSPGTGSEGFYRGTVELLKQAGFAPEGEVAPRGPSWFGREYGRDLRVRLRLAEFAGDLFASMADPGVHIVGYDGHSDIGRNMRRALQRAPDQRGHKLVFYGLCAGKDALFRVRARYPEAQVLTTFNSSYFRTADGPEGRRMVESENFNALVEVLAGIADRQDWKGIRDAIRDRAIPRYWKAHHALPGGMNYVTPIDSALARRVLDLDGDGQADALDRLVDFNAFAVAADTAAEFVPRDPGRPAAGLGGGAIHIAANTCNTAMLYNPLTRQYNQTGRIVGAGHVEMGPDEGIVRWFDIDLDGEPAWALGLNRHHAHMSEEALRAVALYTWNAHVWQHDPARYRRYWRASTAQTPPDRPDRVDVLLMGLVLATFTLAYDMMDGFAGPHRRDEQIWQALLSRFGLPSLDFRPIWSLVIGEHHDYAGSPTIVGKWRETLDAATIAALRGDEPALV